VLVPVLLGSSVAVIRAGVNDGNPGKVGLTPAFVSDYRDSGYMIVTGFLPS